MPLAWIFYCQSQAQSRSGWCCCLVLLFQVMRRALRRLHARSHTLFPAVGASPKGKCRVVQKHRTHQSVPFTGPENGLPGPPQSGSMLVDGRVQAECCCGSTHAAHSHRCVFDAVLRSCNCGRARNKELSPCIASPSFDYQPTHLPTASLC